MLQRLIKKIFFVLHMCFLPSELILVFQTYKCLLSPFKTTACYASCAAILDTSTYVPLPLFFHQIMIFFRGEKSTFSHTKPCYVFESLSIHKGYLIQNIENMYLSHQDCTGLPYTNY